MEQRCRVSSSSDAMVQLSVFKQCSSEIWGEISNMYYENPISCMDMGDFLLKLDAIYENLNYPMANTRVRSFFKNPERTSHDVGSSIKLAKYFDGDVFNLYHQLRQTEQCAEVSNVHQKNMDKPSEVFFIYTIFRQNASWQGEVLWQKTGQKMCFRSALELLHLIQGALQKNKPNDDTSGTALEQSEYLRER